MGDTEAPPIRQRMHVSDLAKVVIAAAIGPLVGLVVYLAQTGPRLEYIERRLTTLEEERRHELEMIATNKDNLLAADIRMRDEMALLREAISRTSARNDLVIQLLRGMHLQDTPQHYNERPGAP